MTFTEESTSKCIVQQQTLLQLSLFAPPRMRGAAAPPAGRPAGPFEGQWFTSECTSTLHVMNVATKTIHPTAPLSE